MRLRILLPFRIFADIDDVARIVAQTRAGSIGVLARRLDFASALAPGILFWQRETGDERFAAVDEGVIVKAGGDVLVSVRNAIHGETLSDLRSAVEQEFFNLDAQEQSVRSALAKLSIGLVRQLSEFQHE